MQTGARRDSFFGSRSASRFVFPGGLSLPAAEQTNQYSPHKSFQDSVAQNTRMCFTTNKPTHKSDPTLHFCTSCKSELLSTVCSHVSPDYLRAMKYIHTGCTMHRPIFSWGFSILVWLLHPYISAPALEKGTKKSRVIGVLLARPTQALGKSNLNRQLPTV